jgi:hypothetical protein
MIAAPQAGIQACPYCILSIMKKSVRAYGAVVAGIVAAAAILSSCARSQPVVTAPLQGSRLSLELTPGPDYRTTTGFLIFRFPIYPQVACWLETDNGRYVGTVYVTAKGARRSWFSAPASGRPEALPVWYHLQKTAAAADAASTTDAVSGATSSGGVRHDSPAAGLPPGRYVAMLEVNRSYDYNDRYTRANAGVNGQPSVIYRCEIMVGQGTWTGRFVPFGTGSVDGSDGGITPGVEGLTTALTLLDSAQITYRPS